MESLRVFITLAFVGWAIGADQSECSNTCQGHVSTPSLAFGLLGARPQIWLFGDSITEYGSSRTGWATLLSERYSRRADVLNRGLSGYNTVHARAILDGLSTRKGLLTGAVLATIFFGANDAAGPESFQAVPLESYAANLRAILARLRQAAPGIVTVVITPPPVDDNTPMTWVAESGRSLERAGLYAAEAVRVAREEGSLCLDLYSAMLAQPGWPALLSDGLHLSARGDAFLSDSLVALLSAEPAARAFRVESMPSHFPSYEAFADKDQDAITRVCEWPEEAGAHCIETA